MAVSKVVLGDETLIDLTGDSVSSENLLQGATAHAANGEQITGGVVVTPMYTGTKAAIEEAIALGQIPEDAVVNITDDEETSSFQTQINEINSSLTDLANYLGYEFGSLIPKLSGDSTSIITSGYNTVNNAYSYYAFDKDENTFYQSSTFGTSDHAYIGYDFGNKQQISKCKIVFINKDSLSDNVSIKIQGSNDKSNWTDISTFSTGTLASGATYKYTKEVSANYRYYRAYKVSSTASSRFSIAEIDFYK